MKSLKIAFLIVFLSGLFFPLATLAGSYQLQVCTDANNNKLCDPGEGSTPQTAEYQGLVPCGKVIKINGGSGNVPCQFCHFFVMFDEVVKFFLILVIIVAVLMFVIAGFMFLVAAGNPSKVQDAKKIMTATAIGLVIIFASWIAVNTIFIFLGVADWTGLQSNWFIIDCPVKVPV